MATFRQGPPAGGNSTLPGKRGNLKSASGANVASAMGGDVLSGLAEGGTGGARAALTAQDGATVSGGAARAKGPMAAQAQTAADTVDVRKFDPPSMPGRPLDDAQYSEAAAGTSMGASGGGADSEGAGQWGRNVSLKGNAYSTGPTSATGPEVVVESFKKPFGAARRAVYGRQ